MRDMAKLESMMRMTANSELNGIGKHVSLYSLNKNYGGYLRAIYYKGGRASFLFI